MPRNSQGDFTNTYDWVQDAANGIDIEPDRHQDGDDDQAQGLTDSLDRQGRGGMNADLAMGNNKLVQLNDGTATTDAANIGQLQSNAFSTGGADTGAADAYVTALSPPITAYTDGLRLTFVAANANTGASTLQVNGVVPGEPLRWQGQELPEGLINVGDLIAVEYRGGEFNWLNVPTLLPVEFGGTGGTTALGTAAYEDVGTDIGDVVEVVDVDGDPGIDPSLLPEATITGECVLSYTSATAITLFPENGSSLVIDGAVETVPDAGVPLDNTGLSTTFHYVYAWMDAAVMTLELSTTVPVKGVGGFWEKTGDSTRAYVGAVNGNASSQYADTATERLVRSFFNDPLKPAQVANAAEIAVTSTTFVVMAGMTLDVVSLIDEAWSFSMDGTLRVDSTFDVMSAAMGLDATVINGGTAVAANTSTVIASASGSNSQILTAGKHTIDVRAKISGGNGVYGTNAADVTTRGILTARPS